MSILKLFLATCLPATMLCSCSNNMNKQGTHKGTGVIDTSLYLVYVANTPGTELRMYWSNDSGFILHSFGRLKAMMERKGKTLDFCCNGGMFDEYFYPQGLYIEEGQSRKTIDTGTGAGNFYMKPNGVFFIDRPGNAGIMETGDFKRAHLATVPDSSIQFATQSGPLLVHDSLINPAFTKGSANRFVRNGVGILANGKAVFIMSKEPVNFYDMASTFRELGCREALYLDGYVSRTCLPEKHWEQMDGRFGVMIAVTRTK